MMASVLTKKLTIITALNAISESGSYDIAITKEPVNVCSDDSESDLLSGGTVYMKCEKLLFHNRRQ